MIHRYLILNLFFVSTVIIFVLPIHGKTTKNIPASYINTQKDKEVKVISTAKEIEKIKPQHPQARVHKYSIKDKAKEIKKEHKKTYDKLSRKALKSMLEEEIREFVNTCIALEYLDEAVRALEQLIVTTKNPLVAKDARLEIADIYFEKGAWKIAGEKYSDFIKLYPADKALDYAQYKAIVSYFYCLPTYDRDQKTTQDVIVMANNLLKKDHPFKTDIINIRSYCYNKLYQHNADIFNQYLKKGSYSAATKRLSHIKEIFTSEMVVDLEIATLTLEYKLACAQRNIPIALELEQKLASYPGTQFTKVSSLETKKPYVDYF